MVINSRMQSNLEKTELSSDRFYKEGTLEMSNRLLA